MAFKFIALFALVACVHANYIPASLDLPYAGVLGYGSSIAPAPLQHGLLFSGIPQAAPLHLQLQSPLANTFVNPHVALAVPQGKTTLSKTFVSTPTYVTSHVSERVHTNEATEPIYKHPYGYGKNVVSGIAPLAYADRFIAQNIGHVY